MTSYGELKLCFHCFSGTVGTGRHKLRIVRFPAKAESSFAPLRFLFLQNLDFAGRGKKRASMKVADHSVAAPLREKQAFREAR